MALNPEGHPSPTNQEMGKVDSFAFSSVHASSDVKSEQLFFLFEHTIVCVAAKYSETFRRGL